MQCRKPGFDPWVGKIPLEKEMATHSSILAWKISWTEDPGGLQSMGLQRVRHDWATNICIYTHIYIWASHVALVVKNPTTNAGEVKRHGIDPWVKIPWRRKWQPIPVSLPGESHGQSSLVGYNSRGGKESDMTEWLTHQESEFWFYRFIFVNLLDGTSGKEPACQCRRRKRREPDPARVRKIPWRSAWQPTPIFLPGESHGQRSLADYSPWGRSRVRREWAHTHSISYTQVFIATRFTIVKRWKQQRNRESNCGVFIQWYIIWH